jgi:chemotaxis-related protein WspD
VIPLATRPGPGDCWNRIGVRGDRSCPELPRVVHCHNCPVFAAAGRRFLDAPSPPGYLEEWTERLATPVEAEAADLEGMLTFRLGEEWLALPVRVLVEVTTPRPVHRVPYRAGLLAGLVNIRGELYLCAHLARLLGIERQALASNGDARPRLVDGRSLEGRRQPAAPEARGPAAPDRLLVVQRESDRWVFPVDAVGQVLRVPRGEVGPPPATVGRAAAHLSRGVFSWAGRLVGLLDDARLFEALRARLR